MARDRQRSKQRQAERRARRLQQQGADGPSAGAAHPRRDAGAGRARATPGPPGIDADHLAAGAPPEELGRSDFVLDHDEALVDRDEHEAALDDEEAAELAEERGARGDRGLGGGRRLRRGRSSTSRGHGAGESGYAVRGRRGRDPHEAHKDRPRVIQFLIAVWAELQRVQWPNRQALVTLTGVVLGFVLIAGGYLGLLDAIFSKLIQAIL